MRTLILSPVIVLVLVSGALAADTTVAVPYGDLITTVLSGLRDAILAGSAATLVWLGRNLPGFGAELIKMVIANRWLDRAVDFGINTTEGAVAGKVLSVDVGSAVVANALTYFMTHAPAWLKAWLGAHEDDIKDRLLARIPVAGTLAPVVGGTAADAVVVAPVAQG